MWKSLIIFPLLTFFFSCQTLPPQTINSYKLQKTITIKGIDDLSGITYSPHTQTYWIVNKAPSLLLEINDKGKILRRISFSKIHDTEDVTWIKKNLFAIVEETQNRLFIFDIKADTKILSPEAAIHTWQAPGVYQKNKGLESVTYNSVTNKLLCASEKFPIHVFELSFRSDGLIGRQVFQKVK